MPHTIKWLIKRVLFNSSMCPVLVNGIREVSLKLILYSIHAVFLKSLLGSRLYIKQFQYGLESSSRDTESIGRFTQQKYS